MSSGSYGSGHTIRGAGGGGARGRAYRPYDTHDRRDSPPHRGRDDAYGSRRRESGGSRDRYERVRDRDEYRGDGYSRGDELDRDRNRGSWGSRRESGREVMGVTDEAPSSFDYEKRRSPDSSRIRRRDEGSARSDGEITPDRTIRPGLGRDQAGQGITSQEGSRDRLTSILSAPSSSRPRAESSTASGPRPDPPAIIPQPLTTHTDANHPFPVTPMEVDPLPSSSSRPLVSINTSSKPATITRNDLNMPSGSASVKGKGVEGGEEESVAEYPERVAALIRSLYEANKSTEEMSKVEATLAGWLELAKLPTVQAEDAAYLQVESDRQKQKIAEARARQDKAISEVAQGLDIVLRKLMSQVGTLQDSDSEQRRADVATAQQISQKAMEEVEKLREAAAKMPAADIPLEVVESAAKLGERSMRTKNRFLEVEDSIATLKKLVDAIQEEGMFTSDRLQLEEEDAQTRYTVFEQRIKAVEKHRVAEGNKVKALEDQMRAKDDLIIAQKDMMERMHMEIMTMRDEVRRQAADVIATRNDFTNADKTERLAREKLRTEIATEREALQRRDAELQVGIEQSQTANNAYLDVLQDEIAGYGDRVAENTKAVAALPKLENLRTMWKADIKEAEKVATSNRLILERMRQMEAEQAQKNGNAGPARPPAAQNGARWDSSRPPQGNAPMVNGYTNPTATNPLGRPEIAAATTARPPPSLGQRITAPVANGMSAQRPPLAQRMGSAADPIFRPQPHRPLGSRIASGTATSGNLSDRIFPGTGGQQ